MVGVAVRGRRPVIARAIVISGGIGSAGLVSIAISAIVFRHIVKIGLRYQEEMDG